MIFINSNAKELDRNVRLAATHAVDKEAIVKRLLRGYGVPLDTLEAPDYTAYDPSIRVPYDPRKAANLMAAAGYSPQKPLKTRIQTTRGFKPKDYEMIQAVVGMWRKIGFGGGNRGLRSSEYFELRTAHQLAPFAFYNWATRLPTQCLQRAMRCSGRSPHQVGRVMISTQRLARFLARKTRRNGFRVGRMWLATLQRKVTSCRFCNMRSRSFTSLI